MHVSVSEKSSSQNSARSSIVVYARDGVICAEGLHFSAFHVKGMRVYIETAGNH